MSKKFTIEEVKQQIKELDNSFILLSEDYKGIHSKLLFKHLKCNNTFEMTLLSFKNGYRCPYCSGKHKYTTEEFQNKLNELTNNKYKMLSEYKSTFKKIKLQCLDCNNTFEMRPNNLINGQGCPYCSGKHRYTVEEIKEIFNKDKHYEIINIDNYKNYKSKFKVKHLDCNRIFETNLDTWINQKSRCPECSISIGENLVYEWLENNNFEFIHNHPFKDCKDKRVLPFDFYLPKENICIEFDGPQHHEETFYSKDLEDRIKKDNIKTEYCKKNNIKLIRINKIKDIEIILTEELNSLKV